MLPRGGLNRGHVWRHQHGQRTIQGTAIVQQAQSRVQAVRRFECLLRLADEVAEADALAVHTRQRVR